MVSEFAPCPLCKQYSHSIGEDRIADAFNHFQAMFDHRGDGIPTQHWFDEKTRDAAQVLTQAVRDQASRIAELEAGLREAERAMTCGNGGAHYCPNCDSSGFNARAKIRALLGEREG